MRRALAIVASLCCVSVVASADVGMPPPSSCPRGARPSAEAHYDSWCEAVTCTDDASCATGMGAPGYACRAPRGLCVRDRDVAGVGWASGHVQHLHEAVSECAAQADCAAGTRCELAKRCERSVLASLTGGTRAWPFAAGSAAQQSYGTLEAVAALVFFVVAGTIGAVAVVLVERKRRRAKK